MGDLLVRAELRTVDGSVEVFVNDERQSRMWGRLSLPGELAPEKLDQYLDADIDVYLTDMDADCTLCWDGEDEYDYAPYDRHIERIVRRKPDIKLILYVGCAGGSPYKWNVRHEDQLPLLSNGDRLRIPSFASEPWLRDSCEALRRFVRHYQDSRFADNIIGYNPIQYSNEWHTPTSRNHPPLDDYSEPMVRHFRTWLREKYGDDADLLRRAWGRNDLDFETAAIPEEARRLRSEMEPLRFGEKDPWVFDYEACLHEAREQFIIGQCRAIKEASEEPTLTCLSRAACSDMMLLSPWVDVHHGPYIYQDRKILHINGYAKATYRARGKLHICQIDTGTHLLPKTGGDPLGIGSIWPGPHRVADSMWDTLQLLERDVAYSVARNSYLYWNEGGPGWMFPVVCHGTLTWGRFWFDAPEIKASIGRLKRVVDDVAGAGARSVARVALVAADYLDPHLPRGSVLDGLFDRGTVQRSLARSGVPVDDYALEDFEGIDRAYAVYIFPNAFYVPGKLREAIRAKLAEDGATAIWLYAPGCMDESGADLANIQALTGFRLNVEHRIGPVQVGPVPGDHPFFRELDGTCSFGSRTVPRPNNNWEPLDEERYEPELDSLDLPAVFWCDDPGAERVAKLEDSDRTAMAVKNEDGFRSIWVGAPQVPWQLYRNMIEHSGVHVYSRSGDQLMANDRFVALHCITGGDKRITLPRPCRVAGALSGDIVAEETRQIRFEAKAGETRSFILEP
jgi:hypothetical protein